MQSMLFTFGLVGWSPDVSAVCQNAALGNEILALSHGPTWKQDSALVLVA